MLVPEGFRKTVTFLYADEPDTETKAVKRVPRATAFYVGVPMPGDSPFSVWYVVTARHVIDDAPDVLWLRARLADGRAVEKPLTRDAWEQHPQTDVAVAHSPFSPPTHDVHGFSLSEFATREFVAEHHVGEGDEVFFIGLFTHHYGKTAPEPIIRFGNVALMPRELVRIQTSRRARTFSEVEAYLVECRSWGGQSGSPAFVTFSAGREMSSELRVTGTALPYALLGLVQGTWKHREAVIAPDPSGEGVVEINVGISIVIPAYMIVETLMADALVERREAEAAKGDLTETLGRPGDDVS